MTVELSIKRCIERIEKHVTSISPQIQIINCELLFLDKLTSLSMNGIELPDAEPSDKTPSNPINEEDENITEGTVLIFLKSGKGSSESETKILYVLSQDPDWQGKNYKVIFTENPEETYNSHWRKVNASRTSKYTLHTGEVAYLIKI